MTALKEKKTIGEGAHPTPPHLTLPLMHIYYIQTRLLFTNY